MCCRLVYRFNAYARDSECAECRPAFGTRVAKARFWISHARARPAVMDANVRAAAAETLRLCREAGHDVSPAVAALYVQAQRWRR